MTNNTNSLKTAKHITVLIVTSEFWFFLLQIYTSLPVCQYGANIVFCPSNIKHILNKCISSANRLDGLVNNILLSNH